MRYQVATWKLNMPLSPGHMISHYIIALACIVPKITLDLKAVCRSSFGKMIPENKSEVAENVGWIRGIQYDFETAMRMLHYSTETSREVHRMPFRIVPLRIEREH